MITYTNLTLAVVLILSLPLMVWAGLPSQYEHALQARMESILYGTPWPSGKITKPICATPVLVEFNASRQNLTLSSWRKILSPTFSTPRPSGLNLTYDSPSGNFRIHYTTSGNDAVYQSGLDINPADGVPDYVNLCGTILDSCWLVEITQLGFTPSPSDAFYSALPGSPDNGGDGKYDVYLDSIPQTGVAGYTASETTQTTGSRRWTSFVVLRNDYSRYSGNLNLLRVTAAHEFFHAIQFGLDVYEYEYIPADAPQFPGDTLTPYKLAWLEMSAVWAEEQVYDDIDDYRSYLPSFFALPWLSLKTFTYSFDTQYSTGYHPYGSCVWPIFLSEKFGTGVIKAIWDRCAQYTGDNTFNDPPGRKSATRAVLDSLGSSFQEAFREFTVWNYFTSSRSVFGVGYFEARDFGINAKIDSIKFHQVLDDTIVGTVDSIAHPPQNLGSNYLVFSPNPQDTAGGLFLSFQKVDDAGWLGTAILFPKISVGGPTRKAFSYNPQTQTWYSQVYNWKIYNEIIMVVANAQTLPFRDYVYTYQAYHDSTLSGAEVFADFIGDNYPNPFILSQSSEAYFPILLSEPSFVNIDIFTVGGELVRQLRLNFPSGGDHTDPVSAPSWDGRDEDGQLVPSGIYLGKVRTKNMTAIRKIALIR